MLSPLSAYSFFLQEPPAKNGRLFATYRRIGGLIAIIPKDWKYLRGDIYYADMEPHIGSEQGGTRPVVVLQNNTGNYYCPTLIVAPITSKAGKKPSQPTHYYAERIHGLELPGMVLLEQIKTIDKRRVKKYLGRMTRQQMDEIGEAIEEALGLYVPEEMEAP